LVAFEDDKTPPEMTLSALIKTCRNGAVKSGRNPKILSYRINLRMPIASLKLVLFDNARDHSDKRFGGGVSVNFESATRVTREINPWLWAWLYTLVALFFLRA